MTDEPIVLKRERTAEIDYVGWVSIADWAEAVTEVFESRGCTVEAMADVPMNDSWYSRWTRLKEENEALQEMLLKVTRYLASMPDAGITLDDPRLKWYVDSKPLRDEAEAMAKKDQDEG